mmetsp:Transcript_26561/g.68167  ORF Transcript_26561/g.68167 Transcript_26561/m.68167 type:complete len:155 (+) Transcript_26561:2070-2534(+)
MGSGSGKQHDMQTSPRRYSSPSWTAIVALHTFLFDPNTENERIDLFLSKHPEEAWSDETAQSFVEVLSLFKDLKQVTTAKDTKIVERYLQLWSSEKRGENSSPKSAHDAFPVFGIVVRVAYEFLKTNAVLREHQEMRDRFLITYSILRDDGCYK